MWNKTLSSRDTFAFSRLTRTCTPPSRGFIRFADEINATATERVCPSRSATMRPGRDRGRGRQTSRLNSTVPPGEEKPLAELREHFSFNEKERELCAVEPIGWSDLPQNQVRPTRVRAAATVSSGDHVFEGCSTFLSRLKRETGIRASLTLRVHGRAKEEEGEAKVKEGRQKTDREGETEVWMTSKVSEFPSWSTCARWT